MSLTDKSIGESFICKTEIGGLWLECLGDRIKLVFNMSRRYQEILRIAGSLLFEIADLLKIRARHVLTYCFDQHYTYLVPNCVHEHLYRRTCSSKISSNQWRYFPIIMVIQLAKFCFAVFLYKS